MDDADRATEEQLAHLADAMRRQRERDVSAGVRIPEGVCLNCDAILSEAKARFCDFECSADWTRRQETARRLQRRL
jgi:hypothetical protein